MIKNIKIYKILVFLIVVFLMLFFLKAVFYGLLSNDVLILIEKVLYFIPDKVLFYAFLPIWYIFILPTMWLSSNLFFLDSGNHKLIRFSLDIIVTIIYLTFLFFMLKSICRSFKNRYLMIGIVVLAFFIVLGLGGYYLNKQNLPSPLPITTAVKKIDSWKTYTNNDYSFQIDYPSRFSFVGNTKREANYDTLATFSSQSKESITLREIHDIDIYKDKKPEDVAKREIMDSGFQYGVIGVKTGDYSAAITTVDNNPDKKYPTITIAHPNKNLFIVLEINIPINGSQGESDKILSSFKFLNNTDISSWKTYTAADNTFSFKFPAQWTVQPNQVFGSRSVIEFQFQNNPLFTITLLGNYNQITGQPFKTLGEYLGTKDVKSMGFVFDGRQAKRVTDPGQAGHVLPSEEVVAFSKDNKYIVSVYFEPDYYPQAVKNKTFDQILSTFKFQ